jgi:glycosyltransferase involved in cell wall biosynthesis
MKVLTVSPSLDVGGLERIAIDLANALAERGAEVAFAAPDGPLGGELDERIARVELRAQGRSPAASLETASRIARAVRALRPDVVHAHNVKASGIAGVGVRLAAIPWPALGGSAERTAGAARGGARRPALVGTFHGVAPGEDRAAAAVLRLASAVACVSEGLAERLRGARGPGSRVTVIPNAVAPIPTPAPAERARLRAELGLGDGPVVASVGRLMAVKAPERFVEMAALVAREVPSARFLMVGDGPLRPGLERRAAELGLGDAIRFAGWRGDARGLIAQADVLVFSSESEGLSVAALEALSAGVPVASTPVTGMAELLGEGAGVVTERHAAPDLAAAVVALLADPADRARRGELGRALVERSYGLPAMVDAYAALFERVR